MMTASRITKKSTTIRAFSPRWEITIPNAVQNTIIPDEGTILKYNLTIDTNQECLFPLQVRFSS